MTCYVIGAGDCTELNFEKNSSDFVVAADGGLRYLDACGIVPDIIIGDFDSLGEIPEGGNIIRLKPEKDVTDMYAAVEAGIERGYSDFRIYGATGGRLDHTLANIQLIASLAQKGMNAKIIDGSTVITSICNSSLNFDGEYSGYISVFAHNDVCRGVSIKGLKYELDNAELSNSFPLGVSNEFIGKESAISVEKGTLIIIYRK